MISEDFSKPIVLLIILLNVAFVIWVLRIYEATSSEPSTLIQCWFAFTTGELWLLATIKKQKIKKGDKDDK